MATAVDSYGNQLSEGDEVLVRARVEKIVRTGENGCNLQLVLVGGTDRHWKSPLQCNSALVARIEEMPEELRRREDLALVG